MHERKVLSHQWAGAMVLLHVKVPKSLKSAFVLDPACRLPYPSLLVQTSKEMEFMLEAQTTEHVAEVLQRLITVHNCCLCILYWKEVWKECSASMSPCTGTDINACLCTP